MTYVFDCSPFIQMFNYYYPNRFPSLWAQFDELIVNRHIISVEEVYREILSHEGNLQEWAKRHKEIFEPPTGDELLFVTEIFKINNFRHLISEKARMMGKPVADPFIIAKAKTIDGCVVTNEKYKINAAKIPNVCAHFKIECIGFEDFMEQEGWSF